MPKQVKKEERDNRSFLDVELQEEKDFVKKKGKSWGLSKFKLVETKKTFPVMTDSFLNRILLRMFCFRKTYKILR